MAYTSIVECRRKNIGMFARLAGGFHAMTSHASASFTVKKSGPCVFLNDLILSHLHVLYRVVVAYVFYVSHVGI